jgi:hypothetical protein
MKVYELFDPNAPYVEFYKTKKEVLAALRRYRAARKKDGWIEDNDIGNAGYIVVDDVPRDVVGALNYAFRISGYNDEEHSSYRGPASMIYNHDT